MYIVYSICVINVYIYYCFCVNSHSFIQVEQVLQMLFRFHPSSHNPKRKEEQIKDGLFLYSYGLILDGIYAISIFLIQIQFGHNLC